MAQLVKVFKCENLTLISGAHVVEGGNWPLQVFLWPIPLPKHTHTPLLIRIEMNKLQ